MNGFWSTATLVALTAGLSAQTPGQAPAPPNTATHAGAADVQGPGRSRHERHHRARREGQLHPRPEEGRVRDLRRRREAGHLVDDGGHRRPRHQRAGAAAAAAARRASSCRRARPRNDVSGRIFLFFVDDLHLQFHNTGRVRELFKKISKELVHEGDMFGIVSSGPSSIAVDMTYDKKRLDEAIKKMAGNELKPTDIINGTVGRGRPERSPLPRARRVLDRQRPAEEPRVGAQPPQGAGLRQRRLRLQSVPGRAPRPDGSELAVRAERVRARTRTRRTRRTATTAARRPIRSRSSRSRARRSPTPIWRASSAS